MNDLTSTEVKIIDLLRNLKPIERVEIKVKENDPTSLVVIVRSMHAETLTRLN